MGRVNCRKCKKTLKTGVMRHSASSLRHILGNYSQVDGIPYNFEKDGDYFCGACRRAIMPSKRALEFQARRETSEKDEGQGLVEGDGDHGVVRNEDDGMGEEGHGMGAEGHGMGAEGHGMGAEGHGMGAKGHGMGAEGHGMGAEGHGMGAEGHGMGAEGHRMDGEDGEHEAVGRNEHVEESEEQNCDEIRKKQNVAGIHEMDDLHPRNQVECCLCERSIRGVVRTVKGNFWKTWNAFCQHNSVKCFEDDLLDNSCYSWIRKYGSKDIGFSKLGKKAYMISNAIKRLQTSRPEVQGQTVTLQPFEDMEVDLDHEYGPATPSGKTIHEGRRILSTHSLCEFVQNLSEHAKSCSQYGIEFGREVRVGLHSQMYFKCRCGLAEFKIDSNSDEESLPINDAMVWGCAQAPLGYDAAMSFLTAMDLKGPGKHTFNKIQRRCYEDFSRAATQTMIEAGRFERKLAEDSGSLVEVDGITYPSVTVKVDGGWGKRSYGHGFNSHCGTAVGIGAKSKKILFNSTRVRTCYVCDTATNQGEDPGPHECFKNWCKTSTAMESNIIQEGFLNSISTHGIVYSKFVGDGDSSTHSAVIDCYKGLQVEKIECTNHVMRNLTRKLMEISQNRKKNIPADIRKISGMATRFERITGGIVGAINYHIQDLSNDSWIHLRNDILNVPRHVFGDHKFCKDYFCKDGQSRAEPNIFPIISTSALYGDVMDSVRRVASLATSLLERMNTNEAECFMSVVNKYLEGKRKHFGHTYGYNLRILSSVLAYNTTTFWIADAYEIIFGKEATTLWKEKQLVSIKNSKRNTKKRMRKRPTYSFLKSKVGDQNYGSCPDKPDLEVLDEREFALRIKDLYESLQVNDTQRKEIEETTRGQASSEAWFKERHSRITASVAHSIARLRPSTDNTATLNKVLGRSFFSTDDTAYGKQHEADAISEYEKVKCLPPGSVKTAGLVVSRENGVLASSPDGFVGENGLLEVKCPSKWRDSDPKTWPRLLPPKNKRTLNDKPELKSSDPYFTQAVMQLYTTGREWVDFFVWTPKGSFLQRIDKNESTHKQWQEIQGKLVDFWKKEMAPELVDSRYLRGREYRCPKEREENREKVKTKRSASKQVRAVNQD